MSRRRSFESEIKLVCVCEFNLRDRNFAAYLLREGNKYCVNFGFITEGNHPFLTKKQMEANLANWSKGIKGFPSDEVLRIHMRSHADDSERWIELEQRADATALPQLQYLNYRQQKKTRELTEKGIRRKISIDLFATYTYHPGKEAGQDLIEQGLAWVVNKYDALKGRRKVKQREIITNVLNQAFNEGFLLWEHQLNTRMGLACKPMSKEQMWSYARREFNVTDDDKIPHLAVLREVDGQLVVEEIISSDLAPASVLIRGENGLPSTPQADDRWVYVKGQYVGAVVLDDRIEGYGDKEHQYSYWFEPFCQIENCEVVVELALANATMTRMKLQRLTRQQKSLVKEANERNNEDVLALMQSQGAASAQKKLIQGDRPVVYSCVFFLYRDSKQGASEACARLVNFLPQGKLIRETDVSWELWRNKEPFTWKRLLSESRRQTYFNDEIPLPLVCTEPLDSLGLELIARQGGMPIYLDFVKQHRGIMIIAKSRRGKSVLAADMIFTALSYGLPVIVLDYGDASGATTYSDLADYLGDAGANIDAADTSNNLLETPNLSRVPADKREKHFATFRSFIVTALETLIMGSERGTRLAKKVHALLNYAVACFFTAPDIDARYQAAHADGFGSEAWWKMPTLTDFLSFVRQLPLDELGGSETIGEAVNETIMQISTWMKSPVGKAISEPSVVRMDAQLLCFSLRGASDDDEATICALGAQSNAIRRALEHPKSKIVVDEGSVLFRKAGLVYSVGEMVANGAKSGISVALISQDIETIANSAAGPQFLANLDVKLVGAIEESAIDPLAHFLKKDPASFLPNTHKNFLPDNVLLCSNWLMIVESRMSQVRHFPCDDLLAIVANNPPERAARERFRKMYNYQLAYLPPFAEVYVSSRRSGKSMDEIALMENSAFDFLPAIAESEQIKYHPSKLEIHF